MEVLNLVQAYAVKCVESVEVEGDSLLDVIVALHSKITKDLKDYKVLKEALEEAGVSWVTCPDCGSPVILEYGDCPYCSASLMEGEDDNSEEEVIKKEKKATKKTTKKTSKKTSKKVEKEEETNEGFDDDEFEETEEKPTKKASKKTSKKVTTKKKPVEEEVEESEEEDFPTEEEISEMDAAALKRIIKKFKLEIKDLKSIKKVDELRDAVNDAIDALCETDDGEEEVEGDDLTPDDISDSEFDIDGMDLDGELEDIDDLGD